MSTLRERNISFFKEEDQDIFDLIERKLPNLGFESLRTDEQGRPVNICLGEINLYGQDEPLYSKTQIGDFFENPNRLAFANPNHCNLSDISFGLYRHIRKFAIGKKFDGKWIANLQVVDNGYFICSGIGLGYHIRDIIDQADVRVFIFSEPIEEFFLFSLDVVDWEEVYKAAEAKDAKVVIVVSGSATQLAHRIERVIGHYGGTFLEGSYFYAHYGSWDAQQTLNILRGRMEGYLISSGFYEDELLMITNTYYNFKHSKFRFIRNQKVLQEDYPVFVIGSGPSLEHNLEDIKKWRDRAVIISCGTTIRLLLKNGIRPDIHIENENGWKTEEILRTVKEEYGLDDIVLACSSTTYPGVQELFDEVWIYVRPALSSTSIFATPSDAITGVGPMVVNAGAGVAYNIGFRKIYLFGADCGKAKNAASHHKDALYHDELGKKLGFTKESLDKVYVRKVEGNFGGEFLTSHFLDMSRIYLSDLNRGGASMVNCSRGAKIDGVPALSSTAINLEQFTPNKQAQVLQKIRGQFKEFQPAEKIDFEALEKWAQSCKKFKKDLSEKVTPLIGEVDNYWVVEQALKEFWSDNFEEYKGVLMVICGSYSNMIRLSSFLGSRIIDTDLRKDFIADSLEKYIELCHWMADELEGVYCEMANGVDRAKLPEPYEGGFKKHVSEAAAEQVKIDLAELG
ncbi:6-hydroxymethylpterin diphosphokinase MptE-like protein [Terasakiella pusilla]|jgi:hypothetical protein|uniref:motility associated factor glycosyltransferase family protein n=1 Tax=Terasakiella pusilla TaxID=64973 RepID=UPI003AA8220E